MNRTLALTTLTVAGIAAFPAVAGAGVRWQPTPPVHVNCDGNNAVSNVVADLDGVSGDTISASWELNNPACAGTEIRFAFHSTASSQWNENEVQPLLLGTAPVHASDLSISWQIPDATYPACHVQIDLITGDPHGQIDRSHRYNEFPIGGSTSRLLAAGYAEDLDCQPPATTTSTTATPSTSVPVEVPPTTPDTVTVSNSTPVTSTPDAVPTDTTAVELLTQQTEILPVTGGNIGWTVGLGGGLIAFGLGLLGLQRRVVKEHQP